LIYVELFTVAGLSLLGVPLRWWPFPILSLGFASIAFASLNTAIGSLPSVALSGEGRTRSTIASGMAILLNIGVTVGAITAIALSLERKTALLPVSLGLTALFAGLFVGGLRLGWRNAERLIEPQS